MYSVTKEFTFDYAHRLILDYPSKCSNIHGHTAKVEVTIVTDNFVEPENDILVNFVDLKEIINQVKERFDHKLILNHKDVELIKALDSMNVDSLIFNSNPTSEVFARVICFSVADMITKFMIDRKVAPSKKMVIKVSFWETPTSFATYMENLENIMKIKLNCNHKGCKCNHDHNEEHKCKCKKDKGQRLVEAGIIVIHKKSKDKNTSEAEHINRRREERKMLLGDKKPETKPTTKTKKNTEKKFKSFVNSILRNM